MSYEGGMSGSSGVWILAEQRNGKVQQVSFELLTRGIALARERNSPLTALIHGYNITGLQELIDRGANEVIYIEHKDLAQFDVERYAICMAEIINDRKPEIIIAGATTTGRTLMPYVAIKIDAGLTADCTGLAIEPDTGNLLQTRPAIGGNIMATIKTPNHRPQMATVRPRSTQIAPLQNGRSGKITKIKPAQKLLSRVVFQGFTKNADEVALAEAERVVVVGRGIKKAENLRFIYELANQIGAAVGATRDVVDRGWLSYPHQVGLSGHTISPKLYIGIGVSGSIQHIAGMQTAEKIIAVNNDPDAHIFKVADIGIVGDLFQVLPVLTARLKARV